MYCYASDEYTLKDLTTDEVVGHKVNLSPSKVYLMEDNHILDDYPLRKKIVTVSAIRYDDSFYITYEGENHKYSKELVQIDLNRKPPFFAEVWSFNNINVLRRFTYD